MPKKDATPKEGVSEEEHELTEEEKKSVETEGRERTSNLRLTMLDELSSKVDRDGMEQTDEQPSDEDEELEQVDKLKEEKETEESSIEEDETLIIDGEQKKVPKSQIYDTGKRALQKELAADKRLEEASRLKKQAEEMLNEARQKTESPSKTEEGAPAKTQEERDAAFKEKRAALIHAIQYGEEEEASKAIDDLFTSLQGTSQAIPEDKIKEQVEKALEDRENKRKQEAAEQIRQKFFAPADQGGFGDIWMRGREYQDAINKAINKRLENKEPNSWETYEAAGKEVRASFEQKEQPQTEIKLDEERRKKKKDTDTVKPAKVKEQTPQPTEQEQNEDDARKAALNEIAKARGQTIM